MEALFGKTFDLLSTMLGFRSERHELITTNIANIDTPGYQPAELTFQGNLEEEIKRGGLPLARTDARHLPSRAPAADYRVVRTDEKVELDKEMGNLAENQLMYNMTVEFLSRKFKGIDSVLREAK